jgi:signal-transduction protein with cAMP-binding, CBS, and nucleotidyltransferase domain
MVDPFDSFRSREPRVPAWLARDLGLDPSISLRNAKRVSSPRRGWRGLRRTPRFQAAEATATIPLFEGLSKNERRLASRLSTPIAVPAGAMLTQQGAQGSEFFIVLEGEVEVFQGGKVVATRGPGSPLGETALLESGPRTATLLAKTPVSTLVSDKREFNQLLFEVPRVSERLRAISAERRAA